MVVFFDDDFLPHRDWLKNVARGVPRRSDDRCITGNVIADGIKGPGLTFEDALQSLKRHEAADSDWVIENYSPYGCNMAFRRTAIDDLWFDERLGLYAWLEDRDFGAAVARGRGRVIKLGTAVGVPSWRQERAGLWAETWLFASHEFSLPPHQGHDDYLPNDTSGPQERWQQPEGVVATGTLYRPTWTAIGQPYRRHRPFAWPLNSSTGGDDLKHQRLPGRMNAELGRGSSAGLRSIEAGAFEPQADDVGVGVAEKVDVLRRHARTLGFGSWFA